MTGEQRGKILRILELLFKSLSFGLCGSMFAVGGMLYIPWCRPRAAFVVGAGIMTSFCNMQLLSHVYQSA